MATQAIHGRKGKIGIANSSVGVPLYVAEVTEYTLEVPVDFADAASNDSSGWTENLPVLREWNIQYSLIASSANYTTAFNGWGRLITRPVKRWLTLTPSTGSPTNLWQGYVLGTVAELTGDVGDIFRLDVEWAGHGPLFYTS